MNAPQPLSRDKFFRHYSQHVDYGGRDKLTDDERLASIRQNGFRSGWLNTLPPYQGGEPQNVIDQRYAPRKGQMVYLVPKHGLQRIDKYSHKIKEGWKPEPHEVLRASQDFPDMHEEYLRAHREAYPPEKADGGAIGGEDEPQRQLSPVGLYSHAADVVQRMPQMKGTPAQFKAMLTRQGVKPDELKHSGYDEKFAGKPLVTKQELAQHFDKNLPPVQETTLGGDGTTRYRELDQRIARGERLSPEEMAEMGRLDADPPATKYHGYQLPGGTNYRETLLHLPQTLVDKSKVPAGWRVEPGEGRNTHRVINANGEIEGYGATPEAAMAQALHDNNIAGGQDRHQSSHWDTPNVLAHLRMSDRALPGGRKALHLEELQSDWAQEARKKGFKGDYAQPDAPPRYIVEEQPRPDLGRTTYLVRDQNTRQGNGGFQTHEAAAHHATSMNQAEAERRADRGVPHAPYVDSTKKWVDLGLKRLLHEAAKGGYDKVVMTPGEEQAKRYDLSKQIKDLKIYKRHGGDGYNLNGKTTNGEPFLHHAKDEAGLEAAIGKDPAKRALEKMKKQPTGETMAHMADEDLRVGGEGMKAFYDQVLPQALEKLAKRHDPEAKVQLHGAAVNPDEKPPYHDRQALERHMAKHKRVHSLDITPKMRASILRGQPAYAGGGRVGFAEGGVPELPDHPARIPTRLVTSKKAASEPHHNVDMESFRATPELYQKNVDLLRDYPNTPRRIARQPHDKLAEQFIEHAKNNLLDLHDRVPGAVKARSKLWYKGANRIVKDLGKQYNLPDHSVAGAIAALSPQKDWFQNVSLAKRVIEAMHGGGRNFYVGFTATPAMEATFRSRDKLNKPKYMPLLESIKGKSLHDLDQMEGSDKEKAARKALWIRLHDETYNSPSYPLVTPEGNFGEPVKTKGGAERNAGWGSLTEIGKAIRALEAAKDPAAISQLMGEKHKVRSFYNNMLDPNSRRGDVTIDTHAVAAALMRALAGKSTEVAHNFSNSTDPGVPAAGGSAISGIQGTYPLYAEAYRRAAKERGILPREMQSITWEAIRSMFNDTFKSNKNNVKAIDDIWHKYRSGKLTQKQAQEQVYAFAGGLKNPDWFPGHDEAPQHPADAGKLPGPGLPGPAAVEVVPGGGRRPAGAVSPSPSAEIAAPPPVKADGGPVEHKDSTEERIVSALKDWMTREGYVGKADGGPAMHAGAGSGEGRLEKMRRQSGDLSPAQKLLPLAGDPLVEKAVALAQDAAGYRNGGAVEQTPDKQELEKLEAAVARQGDAIDKLTRLLTAPQIVERDENNRIKRIYREMPQ